jgi:hypothetical protein
MPSSVKTSVGVYDGEEARRRFDVGDVGHHFLADGQQRHVQIGQTPEQLEGRAAESHLVAHVKDKLRDQGAGQGIANQARPLEYQFSFAAAGLGLGLQGTDQLHPFIVQACDVCHRRSAFSYQPSGAISGSQKQGLGAVALRLLAPSDYPI